MIRSPWELRASLRKLVKEFTEQMRKDLYKSRKSSPHGNAMLTGNANTYEIVVRKLQKLIR